MWGALKTDDGESSRAPISVQLPCIGSWLPCPTGSRYIRAKSDDTALQISRHAKQLFLDDGLLESQWNLSQTLHRPEESDGPVMVYDEPFENVRSFGYNSVLSNGSHVLLYYFVFSSLPRAEQPLGGKLPQMYDSLYN